MAEAAPVPPPTTGLEQYPQLPPIDPDLFAHINYTLETRTMASPIYAFLLRPATLIHASQGHVIFRLPLSTEHMNSGGSLHGGVGATMVDWAGGMAIAAWDGRGKTGVSVDINVTYLKGAKVGEVLEIEGKAERVGGNVAFTSVGLYKVVDGRRGEAVVLGRHTKFVRGTAVVKEV